MGTQQRSTNKNGNSPGPGAYNPDDRVWELDNDLETWSEVFHRAEDKTRF